MLIHYQFTCKMPFWCLMAYSKSACSSLISPVVLSVCVCVCVCVPTHRSAQPHGAAAARPLLAKVGAGGPVHWQGRVLRLTSSALWALASRPRRERCWPQISKNSPNHMGEPAGRGRHPPHTVRPPAPPPARTTPIKDLNNNATSLASTIQQPPAAQWTQQFPFLRRGARPPGSCPFPELHLSPRSPVAFAIVTRHRRPPRSPSKHSSPHSFQRRLWPGRPGDAMVWQAVGQGTSTAVVKACGSSRRRSCWDQARRSR